MDARQLYAQLRRAQDEIKAKEKQIRILTTELSKVREERDTYSDGLHQLKSEMFGQRLQDACTTQPTAH